MNIASFLSLVALATVAGCAVKDEPADADVGTSDVVGVTDLSEMEAALGLVKDAKLPNGQWSRGDDKLQGGECWKARFASAAHDPLHWEFRRYTNGAAFFRKLGVTPLEGDERAIHCVDIDTDHGGGGPATYSLEGLSLDLAIRMKLGKLQGGEGGAGHLYLSFDRQALEVRDDEHLCGFYQLEGHENSIDPALKAGALTLQACGESSECGQKAYEACKVAFRADAQNEGSIDRPALSNGERVVRFTTDKSDPSVGALVYRYATKANTDAARFSMAADPVGYFQSERAAGVDNVTVYDRMEVHHVTLNGHVEALYLTAVNEAGDPAATAKASCERSIDGDGQPTTAYACKGL